MLSLLVFDSNKKVTNRILTGISSEKMKPLDTNLEPTISNLANHRVILRFNNSLLVKKSSTSLYSNFIFNLYMVYGMNNWPPNSTNTFSLKSYFFRTVKLE